MTVATLSKEELLKGLAPVVGVVAKNTAQPILANLHLSFEAGTMKILGTNIEQEQRSACACDGGLESPVTVNAKKLSDVTKALPDGTPISFSQKGSMVVMKAGKSKFSLQTLPEADYPFMRWDSSAVASRLALPQSELKKALSLTAFAMADKDLRAYLNGLLFDLKGGQLRVVGTDGHRLGVYTFTQKIESPDFKFILPRKVVLELQKLLTDNESALVNVSVSGGDMVQFDMDSIQIRSKLIVGSFPDYMRVLGGSKAHGALFDRIDLLNAGNGARIMTSDKFRGVQYSFGKESFSLTSRNNEQELSVIEVEAKAPYGEIDSPIGLNIDYVQDVLSAMKTECVHLSYQDANSSVLFKHSEDDSSYVYVVMPMRI